MTLFKLWLTFMVMENYEQKIIIPTKSTACNSIHTSMIFVPKSHNYNLLWGWKGYDTAYPCKECSYYKILSIFLPQQSKKTCSIVRSGSSLSKQLIVQAVFPIYSLPLSTVYSVWQVPVSLSCVEAHGWVARICQP